MYIVLNIFNNNNNNNNGILPVWNYLREGWMSHFLSYMSLCNSWECWAVKTKGHCKQT